MKSIYINASFFSMWLSSLSDVLSNRLRDLVIPLLVLSMTHSPLATALVESR